MNKLNIWGFRPLSGIMFSIGIYLRGRYTSLCFRPLSGIMFSIITGELLDEEKLNALFPSPLGDYVFNLHPFLV